MRGEVTTNTGEPMDDVVSGRVVGVTFTPGRSDGLLTLDLWSGDPSDVDRDSRKLFTSEPDSDVKVDGVKVGGVALLTHLAGHACRVKLWPLSGRYGGALRAEFETEARHAGSDK